MKRKKKIVSVPIWGLFNLTSYRYIEAMLDTKGEVSVPIWGLFNLTSTHLEKDIQIML